MARPAHVAVVGGGFSGALTALHLLRESAPGALRVTLVSEQPQPGRGLAYRFDDDNLLLNVPAGNMSAWADEPGHFLAHLQRIDPSLSAGAFVSRRLFGEYLSATWVQAQAERPEDIHMVHGEATGLARAASGRGWQIALASGESLQADQVVLALGHQAVRCPVPVAPELAPRVLDPWDFAAMYRLPPGQPVLVLGTGHTAVDALFCLSQGSARPVYLLSRHGRLPQRHRLSPTPPRAPGFPAYLQAVPPTVRACTRALRQHLAACAQQGQDWRDVLNELRPHTPQLWQSWPLAEQRRFLRHLQALWDVHRHRLAPTAAQRLDGLLAQGRAQVLAGRLLSLQSHAQGLSLAWRPRGSEGPQQLQVCAVVNAIGPSTDLARSPRPLVHQLLQAGLVQPDALGLGLNVGPQLQVLGSGQQPVEGLWYVGPWLKARFWEATAVPELRQHAQKLARHLLSLLSSPQHAHACAAEVTP